MVRYLPWVLAGLAFSSMACGPTDEEAGRAVLFVSPLFFAISVGWLHLFLFLWRKLRPELSLASKPLLITGAVLVVLAIASLIGVSQEGPDGSFNATTNGIPGVMEWVGMALAVVGSSFMTLHLVSFRIWLAAAPKTAFSWSHLPVLVILLAPAVPMAFGGVTNWDEVIMPLWIFPGYVGLVTGPLLLVLLIELWVRIARQKKRQAG